MIMSLHTFLKKVVRKNVSQRSIHYKTKVDEIIGFIISETDDFSLIVKQREYLSKMIHEVAETDAPTINTIPIINWLNQK